MGNTWNAKGVEAAKKGELQEAVKCFKQGLLEEPQNISMRYNLGVTYKNLVKQDFDFVDEAMSLLVPCAQENHMRAWIAMGNLFDPLDPGKFAQKIKDNEKAVECYKKALTLTKWEGKPAADVLLAIGKAYMCDFRTKVEGAAYVSLAYNYKEGDRKECERVLKLCKEKFSQSDYNYLLRVGNKTSFFEAVKRYYRDKGEEFLKSGGKTVGESLYHFGELKRVEAEEACFEAPKGDKVRWCAEGMVAAAEISAKQGEYFQAACLARGAWKDCAELENAREMSENYCLGMKEADVEAVKSIESSEDTIRVLRDRSNKETAAFWNRSIEEIMSEASQAKEKTFTVSDDDESLKSDALTELDSLIGLDALKKDVREMISLMKIQKMREEAGMKTMSTSKHLVFTGNPGTGKTTVARIIGRVYKDLGILSGGQLVETAREDLVAGYIGQTAIKTQAVIEEAMGGVLFIDEAYTLSKGDDKDFGQEAIDAILKVMEDNRDDFVVIVAGYPEQMSNFINSNPGLKSRFNKYLHFPDYTAEEMEQIFNMQIKAMDFVLDDGAKEAVKQALAKIESEKDENFANGREVRNLLEKISMKQAMRLAAAKTISLEELKTIRLTDVIEAMK